MDLAEALGVRAGDIVAFVGGGGKTTALFRLAQELAPQGQRVITTTTTKIFPPQEGETDVTLLERDREALFGALGHALGAHRRVTVALGVNAEGKLEGIPSPWVEELRGLPGVDTILVEADGAARKPFKAPNQYEPVIPPTTTLVVLMVGVEVLGKPLEASWVHRPERVAELLEIPMGSELTPELVAQTLLHPRGGMKGVPPGARVGILVNKVDGPQQRPMAVGLARALLQRGAPQVALTCLKEAAPVLEICTAGLREGPSASSIEGVVLAAGQAVRMGQPKLLLEWQGKPLIRHVVEEALRSRLREVTVVVGYEGARVYQALAGLPLRLVVNPDFAQGQSTSLAKGIEAVAEDAVAALLLLGDQPLVTAALVNRLIAAYEQGHTPIVAPVYGGQRGNPVLFDRALFPELLAVRGDQGGREMIARHQDALTLVPVESPLMGLDVDTWEDYQRLQALPPEAIRSEVLTAWSP